jgi:hypothetical protein
MTRIEHLLFCLSEECDEVGQRASKAARFGLHEIQPGQDLDNTQRLMGEFCDLIGVMEMLFEAGLVNLSEEEAESRIQAKKAKVEEYLIYSAKCGTLTPSSPSSPQSAS